MKKDMRLKKKQVQPKIDTGMLELDASKRGFILGKDEKAKLLQIKARAKDGLLKSQPI